MSDVSMLVAEWKAEIAGLRTAWEQAVAERDAARAEIVRLKKVLSQFHEEDDGQPTEQEEWRDYDRDC